MAKSKRKGKSLQNKAPEKRRPRHTPVGSSLLGWIVLAGPASIFIFTLLFGRSIPYLVEQGQQEAERAAAAITKSGEEFMSQGNYQEAYNRFMTAIEIKDDYAEAYVDLGRLYFLNNDIDQAIIWLQRAVNFDTPQKPLMQNNLGLLYAQKGRFESALSMFQQASKAGLNLEQIYNNIGNVSMSLGNYPEAIQAFQAAIDQRPTTRHRYEEMLRKILLEYRDDAAGRDVYETVQKILAEGISDADLARYDHTIIDRYGRSPEREGQLYKSLGRAIDSAEQWSQAVPVYEQALKYRPDDKDIHYRLGLLYFNLRQLPRAKAHLDRALQIDPRMEKAQEALGKVIELMGN